MEGVRWETCLIDYTTWLLSSGNAQSRVVYWRFVGAAPSPVRGRKPGRILGQNQVGSPHCGCREVMTCVRGCILVTDPNRNPLECVPRVWWSVLCAVAETEVDGALTAVSKRVLRSAAVV